MVEIPFILAGEIDAATAPRLRADLAAAVGGGNLLVDCRRLTFIDCAGVGVLCEAGGELAASGYRLMIFGLTGMPRRVFEMLDLTDMFQHETEPAFAAIGVNPAHPAHAPASIAFVADAE